MRVLLPETLTRRPVTGLQTVIIINNWLFYGDKGLGIDFVWHDSSCPGQQKCPYSVREERVPGLEEKTSQFLPAIILFPVPSLIFSTSSPNWPSSPLLVAYRTEHNTSQSPSLLRQKEVRVVTKTSLELDSSIGRLWGTFRSRRDGADKDFQ